MELKIYTLSSHDGERSLAQHIFKPKEVKRKWTLEKYIGNISLCGKIHYGNENEEIEEFSKIETENLMEDDCCKSCLKAFRNFELKTI